ncbi:MAG: hypothetical protein M1824_002890 [Vezdaea acicularis]|nr:MAG: hypothetical protein M1824_002890 [Vezdaea acicularis]
MAAQQSWTSGFWDCFSPGSTCALAYCCPCIIFGRTQELRKNPSAFPPTVNTDCLIFCGLMYLGVPCIYQALKREELRNQYNLEGTTAKDWLLSCCCGCCVLVQENKEVVHRNAIAAGTAPTAGYQAPPEKMNYQPQP